MTRAITRRATAASMAAALLVALAPAAGARPDALRAQGAVPYARYCAGCHGAAGDGHGPAAPMLITKPRDFTSGRYKFRSTPIGSLPTDDDIYRTITRGLAPTSMPEWSLLAERERRALVAYVKGFYPQWDTRPRPTPIVIPPAPPSLGSPAAVARGEELYRLLGCVECHGERGLGDGPSAATLAPDAWGNPQRPANFTIGRLKGGPAPEDIYRTFMTGLDGSAMPSYYDIFAEPDGENLFEGDAWNLVSYVLSLRATPVAGRKEPAP